MSAELLLAGALFIIMIGMGLGLVVDDFKRVLVYPKAVAVGLLCKVLLLPLFTFSMLMLLPDRPMELAVGFVLLASCPGGATSNVIAGLARSDVALSITLTAMASFITVVTIPLFTNFAIEYFGAGISAIELPVGKTILRIIGVTVFPVSLGMLVKRFKPTLADKADRPVRIISAILLIVIIVGIVMQNRAHLGELMVKAGPLSLLVNLVALALGYFLARLFRLSEQQAVTISIETGIINGALGIAIASTIGMGGIAENVFAFPSAIYSLVMYGSIVLLIWWGNKKLKSGQAAA